MHHCTLYSVQLYLLGTIFIFVNANDLHKCIYYVCVWVCACKTDRFVRLWAVGWVRLWFLRHTPHHNLYISILHCKRLVWWFMGCLCSTYIYIFTWLDLRNSFWYSNQVACIAHSFVHVCNIYVYVCVRCALRRQSVHIIYFFIIGA